MSSREQVIDSSLFGAGQRIVRAARAATVALLGTATFWAFIAFSAWQSNNSGNDYRTTEDLGELAGHSCAIAILVASLSAFSLAVARHNGSRGFAIAALAWASIALSASLWTDTNTPPPTAILIVLLIGAISGCALQGTAAWVLHQQYSNLARLHRTQ